MEIVTTTNGTRLYLDDGETAPAQNALTEPGYWSMPFTEGARRYCEWTTYKRPPIIPSEALAAYFERPRWIVWVHGTKSAKSGKVPLNCLKESGGEGIEKDPTAWGTLERANHRYRNAEMKDGLWQVDGIGLTMTRDDPLICVDFDPQKEAFPTEIIPSLWANIFHRNLHVHASPSGKGWHVIGFLLDTTLQARVKAQADCAWHTVSVMAADCFVTVTDRTANHGELQDISPLVNRLLIVLEADIHITGFDGKHTRTIDEVATEAEIQSFLAKLRGSGQAAKFNRLFDQPNAAFMRENYVYAPTGKRARSAEYLERQADKAAKGIVWRRFSAWHALATILIQHNIPDVVSKAIMHRSWMTVDGKFSELRAADPAAYFLDNVRKKNSEALSAMKQRHNFAAIGLV